MGAIAEAFTAYAQPLLNSTDGSFEQMQRALSISQLCYNLALFPDAERDAVLDKMRSTIELDDEEFDDFQRCIVGPMIRRHEEMFPLMHRRASIRRSQGRLSQPSEPTEAVEPAPTEKRAVADRYAPCPCNSGEKYKFCCGKKGR